MAANPALAVEAPKLAPKTTADKLVRQTHQVRTFSSSWHASISLGRYEYVYTIVDIRTRSCVSLDTHTKRVRCCSFE